MQNQITRNTAQVLRDEDLDTMVGGSSTQQTLPAVQSNTSSSSANSSNTDFQARGIIAI
jgi:hypothetical protein